MAGTLKVGTITTPSGSGSITIPSGVAMTGHNYPAFSAKLGSNQNITNATYVKIQYDTEDFDTNNAYDSSTNYRFTIPSGYAGKYCLYAQAAMKSNANDELADTLMVIYKNGSEYKSTRANHGTHQENQMTLYISSIEDCVVGDYFEIYGYINDVSGTPTVAKTHNSTWDSTWFSMFRIGA